MRSPLRRPSGHPRASSPRTTGARRDGGQCVCASLMSWSLFVRRLHLSKWPRFSFSSQAVRAWPPSPLSVSSSFLMTPARCVSLENPDSWGRYFRLVWLGLGCRMANMARTMICHVCRRTGLPLPQTSNQAGNSSSPPNSPPSLPLASVRLACLTSLTRCLATSCSSKPHAGTAGVLATEVLGGDLVRSTFDSINSVQPRHGRGHGLKTERDMWARH
jgi:hypothetical protein